MSKRMDSNSKVQARIENVIFRKVKKDIFRDGSLYKPTQPIIIDTEGKTYISPDFYSEKSKVIGEIHSHIGRLKSAQMHKISNDILKMLLHDELKGETYSKYIAVCDKEEYVQLKEGKSFVATAIKGFNIEVLYVELEKNDYEDLANAMKKQNLVSK